MTLTYDFIPGTDIYIHQRQDMFRINSDTAMLASFMKIHKGEQIIDIGTNNGALLAAASQYQPSYMYGIEIQHDAVLLARQNMEALHITHVEIIEGDVKALKLPSVDVVICNPPYFKNHQTSNKNLSQTLAIARHEVYLTLETLAQKVSEALVEKGRFYMVHRSERIIDIANVLRKHRLEICRLQFIHDEKKEHAVGVLIEARKDGSMNCHVIKPFIRKR